LFAISCAHIILLRNSSFSWWGAWLAKSKRTVAPSIWFAEPDASKDLSDLYLPGRLPPDKTYHNLERELRKTQVRENKKFLSKNYFLNLVCSKEILF
jgi:hypothetical protein